MRFFHRLARFPAITVLFAAIGGVVVLHPSPADAVPAFARQTSLSCDVCHIGSFGPNLTPYGRAFKLNGYVWGEGGALVPRLSGMVQGSFNRLHTELVQPPGPTEDFKANNNLALDQASLFYAGPIAGNVGALAQATYNGVTNNLAMDNTDIRYADSGRLANRPLVYGVTLNNNPTVSDALPSTPAWGYPYIKSQLAPTPGASTLIEQLGARVVGLGAYALYDDLIYAELADYRSIDTWGQRAQGLTGAKETDRLTGLSPYWRLALTQTWGHANAALGTYGITTQRYPGNNRQAGADRLTDMGYDGSYQYIGDDNTHIFTLYGTLIRERQMLGASSDAAVGAADNQSNMLNSWRANASYTYDNTYGLTLARFGTTGTTDATLYGTRTGRPDSAGWSAEISVTPFGKANSWGNSTLLNPRIGLQYVAYQKFDGAKFDYDGSGRNAADNNTLYLYTWLAF